MKRIICISAFFCISLFLLLYAWGGLESSGLFVPYTPSLSPYTPRFVPDAGGAVLQAPVSPDYAVSSAPALPDVPEIPAVDEPGAAEPESAPEPEPEPGPQPKEGLDSAVEQDVEQASESHSDDILTISDFSVIQYAGYNETTGSRFAEYSHYDFQNSARYDTFIGAFPDLSVTAALALVNVNADYGYYNNITLIQNPASLTVLTNKNYQLPADYVPQGMRSIAGTDLKMVGEAAAAYETMQQALKDELGLPLVAVSAYRSFHYQEALYNRYAKTDGVGVADTYSARAGHSEHQTGLTVDFLHMYPSGSLRRANFQNTEQYKWLLERAHEYGFILRYPKGDEPVTGYMFEPWHWRYIGPEDASRMFEAGITTFEEYIGTYYSLPSHFIGLG